MSPAPGWPAYRHLGVDLPAPHVLTLTLRRPPVNALDRDLRGDLVDAFDRIQEDDEVRAVVLTAEGRIFCAGADIREKGALGDQVGDRSRADRVTRETFFAVVGSAKPVVAAVQGGALGAGFVLAACCDLIVSSDEAFFAMPEIDVGQGGGASFLQRILPAPTMRRMLLTGERVPAAELHRLGAVQQVVPATELQDAARSVASVIAVKSPLAVRAIRSSFTAVEALPLREGFDLEQRYTRELSSSPDAVEARRAFFEKRPPTF